MDLCNDRCIVGSSRSALGVVLIAPAHDRRNIELATMAAWYHSKEKLGLGHTFPIGEPWLPGSSCTSFLTSHPYPFGPEFEKCSLPNGIEIFVLWLLPITEAERHYKSTRGVEALEQRFEATQVEYWRPDRVSAVPAEGTRPL